MCLPFRLKNKMQETSVARNADLLFQVKIMVLFLIKNG